MTSVTRSDDTEYDKASGGKYHRKNTAGLMPPWKPGQSGNPNGRPREGSFYDVLCAHAGEKPVAGDARTRFQFLVEAIWRRALGGTSRHAQLIMDRLVPHKSIQVHENSKTVQVLMQIAVPPDGWKRAELVDVATDTKLLDSEGGDDRV